MSNYDSIIQIFFHPTVKNKTGLSVHCDFNKHGLAAVYQKIREGKVGTAWGWWRGEINK